MNTQFAGVADLLRSLGTTCTSRARKPLEVSPSCCLLVIPPPTGNYDAQYERWRRDSSTLFDSDEIRAILGYIHRGGSLLGFAYRFGDSFTQSNLAPLCAALGCLLNDDAIVDFRRLQPHYPLDCFFETTEQMVPLAWAAAGVAVLRWRSMATFTILPGASARPLVLSPGGSCISYNRTHHQVSFQSHPIAVAGTYGAGRFALFGGPHAFETSRLGLLHEADNAGFLKNVAGWLLSEGPSRLDDATSLAGPADFDLRDAAQEHWRRFSKMEIGGTGAEAVAFVEEELRNTDTLRALSLPTWIT